jgi:hypothetical protein
MVNLSEQDKLKKVKEKIMDFLRMRKSVLFDDLEEAIPELKYISKEDDELIPMFAFAKPMENIVIWAMSDIGQKAVHELHCEDKVELKPYIGLIGLISYSAGITSLYPNEAQYYPILESEKDLETPHWCPCALKLKKRVNIVNGGFS